MPEFNLFVVEDGELSRLVLESQRDCDVAISRDGRKAVITWEVTRANRVDRHMKQCSVVPEKGGVYLEGLIQEIQTTEGAIIPIGPGGIFLPRHIDPNPVIWRIGQKTLQREDPFKHPEIWIAALQQRVEAKLGGTGERPPRLATPKP